MAIGIAVSAVRKYDTEKGKTLGGKIGSIELSEASACIKWSLGFEKLIYFYVFLNAWNLIYING